MSRSPSSPPPSPTKSSLLEGIDIPTATAQRRDTSRAIPSATRLSASSHPWLRYLAYALVVLGAVGVVVFFATRERIPAREGGLVGPSSLPKSVPRR